MWLHFDETRERFESRYFDKANKEKKKVRRHQLSSELDFLTNAGPLSIHFARTVRCEALIEWYGHRQTERCVKTAKTEVATLQRAISAPLREMEIGKITHVEIAELRTQLRKQHVPGGVNAVMSKVRLLFRLAVEAGFLDTNPAATISGELSTKVGTIRRPKTGARQRADIRYPTKSEHDAMRHEASALQLAGIDLCAETGATGSEINGLHCSEIDYRGRRIRFAFLWAENQVVPFEHDQDRRTAPMTDRLAATLLRLEVVRRNNPWNRPGREHLVLPQAVTNDVIGRLAQSAGGKLAAKARELPPSARAKMKKASGADGDGNADQYAAPKKISYIRPPFTLGDLGHIAVLRWIREKKSLKQIGRWLGRVDTGALLKMYGKYVLQGQGARFVPHVDAALEKLMKF